MTNKSTKAFKIGIFGTIIALMTIFCFVLTGCDPSSYQFSHEELSDIVSVELINYDNTEQRHFVSWVPDHSSDLKPFDDSKLSVLETLDEDKIPDLIDTLCEYYILHTYYVYDSPKGICLKLSYSNGDFLIAGGESSAGYIGIFNSEGEVAEFIGCFSNVNYFETLVNNYFETKI